MLVVVVLFIGHRRYSPSSKLSVNDLTSFFVHRVTIVNRLKDGKDISKRLVVDSATVEQSLIVSTLKQVEER